jgi:hypothetical protein
MEYEKWGIWALPLHGGDPHTPCPSVSENFYRIAFTLSKPVIEKVVE